MNPPAPVDELRDVTPAALADEYLVIVGRLGSMSRRDAGKLIARAGGKLKNHIDDSVTLIVTGENVLPVDALGSLESALDDATQSALQSGRARVITETELWQRLGLIDADDNLHRLYTPAMLADLLGVSVSVIRRWHRRGLIVPAREVQKLPYFDFQEVATARRLAELLAAGVSPARIERQLDLIRRLAPDVHRPLAQLSVIVEGQELLLRQGDGLLEPGGQFRLDFSAEPHADDTDATADTSVPPEHATFELPTPADHHTPDELLAAAHDLDDAGRLADAVQWYRAAVVAGADSAETHFELAEALYRAGEPAAARERYYVAVERDPDFLEARFNLACILAEQGDHDLAVAAFEGALSLHPDYADAHYHLARLLDDRGEPDRATGHWKTFLDLAPNAIWADEARRRLSDD